MTTTLHQAASAADIEAAHGLFLAYAESLDFSLCFQGFDGELAQLPGYYAPPTGRVLLARVDGELAGCIALRDLGEGNCEMKRLYVDPGFRGLGLGRRLAEAVIAEARAIGYARIRLDTLPSMVSARALYDLLGFTDISAYYHNPVEGAAYKELVLRDGPAAGAAQSGLDPHTKDQSAAPSRGDDAA